jgi:membrane protease subunit (stomatin/prohibitin family)
MGLMRVIEWLDNDRNTIVHKVNFNGNTINKGSMLTVRDGQVAIFADRGKMADVFLPGTYKLDTHSIPILTRLLSWKYGFEKPFKSDIYFVRTTQFVDQKWGTTNPIILRDKDYGAVRVRGFGAFSFRVEDAYVFMQELSGTGSSYKTEDIAAYLRSLIVTDMTKVLGQAQVPVLDLAANVTELADLVVKSLQPEFSTRGMQLVRFNVENFSLPPELEKMMDTNTSMGMIRNNVDVVQQMAAAEALKAAAANPGTAGGMMGAGMGAGMGIGLGQVFGNAFAGQAQQNNSAASRPDMTKCSKCGTPIRADAKFCRECGTPTGTQCPQCNAILKADAKFCHECGKSLQPKCIKCGAELTPNVKFCPECGAENN